MKVQWTLPGEKSYKTPTVKHRLLDQCRKIAPNGLCSFVHFLIHLFLLGKMKFLPNIGRMKILGITYKKA